MRPLAKALFLLVISSSLVQLPLLSQSVVSGPDRSTLIAASSATVVPMLVRFVGLARRSDGSLLNGKSNMTFLVYKDAQGGDPLWMETQSVATDANGRYEVNLGSTYSSGLPTDLFGSGEARWLEVQIAGQLPEARILLTSVPYALKAADAATLGGLPASAFLLAGSATSSSLAPAVIQPAVSSAAVTTSGGTKGTLPVFSSSNDIENSTLYFNATGFGIGRYPAGMLDVNGNAIIRGSLDLSRAGDATTSAGYPSKPFFFQSSVYNSTDKTALLPYFQVQSEPTGNNTANTGATMNFLYYSGVGGAGPQETGLYFNPNGTIHFAPGQTFASTESSTVAVNGTSASGSGVQGSSSSSNGVYGQSSSGDGVQGLTAGTANNTAGIRGVAGTGNTSGFTGIAGVWGDASAHVGVFGSSDQYDGVFGDSKNGNGVEGTSSNSNGVTGGSNSVYGAGVYGYSNASGGVGVTGQGGASGNGASFAAGSTVAGYVAGSGVVASGAGSSEYHGGSGGMFYGGDASGTGTGGDGVYAVAGTNPNNTYAYAGVFIGNVTVDGTLNADAKNFQIDHPLDPANKYLNHTSIESSEMVNIYSGNVTTDAQGLATVQLPAWFEAENGDLRYQLTPIGQFAQSMIANELSDGRFTIRTDKANVKVSWQITGVRQDAYAKAHPLVVEQEKDSAERGFYRHPELFGQPKESSIAEHAHPRPKQLAAVGASKQKERN